MDTKQPKWRLITQLGDVHPVEYGGLFIYKDATGAYPEEAEKLISPDSDEGGQWIVYRFILDRYTPETLEEEWFAKDLASVASYVGSTRDELVQELCSEDASKRARALESIGNYHGFDNLDSYPDTYTKRSDLPRRIRRYKSKH